MQNPKWMKENIHQYFVTEFASRAWKHHEQGPTEHFLGKLKSKKLYKYTINTQTTNQEVPFPDFVKTSIPWSGYINNIFRWYFEFSKKIYCTYAIFIIMRVELR